jgi:hypothetical protein
LKLSNCGSGKLLSASGAAAAARRAVSPPSTMTKDGQKPSRQLRSVLQLDWLIARLRPNSVSSGST